MNRKMLAITIALLAIGTGGKLHILWTEVPDNEVYYDSYPK